MTSKMSKFAKVGALALAAMLTMSAPAFAKDGGKSGESHGKSGESHGKSEQAHSKKKPKPAKPVIDLSLVTVTPGQAAANAITAAGGTGQVTGIKLEAEKKGMRLSVDVLTPTGEVEVKLNLDGTLLKAKLEHDHDDDSKAPLAAVPAVDQPWSVYTANLPTGASAFKISISHKSRTNTDVVKVEYYKIDGKKAKVMLNLDGSAIV